MCVYIYIYIYIYISLNGITLQNIAEHNITVSQGECHDLQRCPKQQDNVLANVSEREIRSRFLFRSP